LQKKEKYLVTFTVGYNQRHNIDKAVKKVEVYTAPIDNPVQMMLAFYKMPTEIIPDC
jgi:hypothetical protein